MRPVLLEIQGFASYRQRSRVDFRGIDFFALVGPTGSGKSTIIDAIVFALYGTVPRWDDKAAVAPALAPSVNRGVVKLIFDAGGTRYVAARDVRRAKSGSVTVKEARLERFADSEADGSEENATETLAVGKAVSPEVSELLGLTFEQFTKSVALPQGEFAQFLHSTGAERQAILKSLLGYRVYDDIQRAANARATNQETRVKLIEEQLADYSDATDEAASVARRRVDELETLQTHVTEVALVALEKSLEQAAEARALVETLDGERLALAKVEIPSNVEQLDAETTLRRDAVVNARADRDHLVGKQTQANAAVQAATPRHVLENIIRSRRELDQLDTDAPELIAVADQAKSDLESANLSSESADRLLETARRLNVEATQLADDRQSELIAIQANEVLLEALTSPDGVGELGQSVRVAQTSLDHADAALTAALASQTAAASALGDAPDPVDLAEVFTAAEDLRTDLAADIAEAESRAEAIAAATAARAKETLSAEDVAAAAGAVRDAEHADRAATIRADLSPGDDCPVCGHVVHELLPSRGESDVGELRDRLEHAEREHRLASDACLRLNAVAERAKMLREERFQRCEVMRKRVVTAATTRDWTDSVGTLASPLGIDSDAPGIIAAAEALIDRVKLLRERRADLEEARNRADAAVKVSRGAVTDARDAVDQITADVNRARTQLSAARDKVSALDPPSLTDRDVESAWSQLTAWGVSRRTELAATRTGVELAAATAADFARDRTAQLAECTTSAAAARTAVTLATAASTEATTRLAGAQSRRGDLARELEGTPDLAYCEAELQRVTELQTHADDVGVRLAHAQTVVSTAEVAMAENDVAAAASRQELMDVRDPLACFGAPQLGDVSLTEGWQLIHTWAAAEYTARSAKIAAHRSLAADADQRVAEARTALLTELQARGITVADGQSANELRSTVPVAVAGALATAEAESDWARQQLDKAKTLQAQMAAADESAKVARQLSKLMQANRFPQWLMASALDTLLLDASAILMEVSGGQFELQRHEGDLRVIDHNDADMPRPVKTLSGGETFQASLALALALSAQVTALSASGGKKLESILLDEGFGTLDENTLDIVASSLENLASTGSRLVGVITHVSALAERIPVRFQVRRDSLGSHIEREQV